LFLNEGLFFMEDQEEKEQEEEQEEKEDLLKPG